MYIAENILFLLKGKDILPFCKVNNIPYRTLQDIYLKKTLNPRIDILVKLSKIFNISLDTLVLSHLEDLLKQERNN